jgi:hypothetical protein
MSGYQNIKVQNTNPLSRDENIGPWCRDGFKIDGVVDYFGKELPFYFKFIWVTTPGDVVFENQNGELKVIESLPARFLFPAYGRKILASGTPSKGNWGFKSTTAADITVWTSE